MIEQDSHSALEAIFNPKSVAVIGGTDRPDTVGYTLMKNLLQGSEKRKVYPVNLKRSRVMDLKAYSYIGNVPEQVDLAVIVTPAPTVPGIIAECVEAGVKGAIIISAGFREFSPAGAMLEAEILAEANKGDLRIIGPNCLGIMNPRQDFNATFAQITAKTGNIAFISQSGALCSAILDWSIENQIGFSAFVSIGGMMDIDWGDLITYLGQDYRTKAILLYMESVGNARAFFSAAREAALNKPIIVLKAGKTAQAATATVAHTGLLTDNDAVLEAAFNRSGVLRVNRMAHLFSMAHILSKQPDSRGPRLAILSNAGGPAIQATDFLIRYNGELAELSLESFDALNAILPPHWSRNNPVDILGHAEPETFAQAFEVLLKDKANDAILCILTPQIVSNPTETARLIVERRKKNRKPILACWMGGASVAEGREILNSNNIPTFEYPDLAARMFNYMWQHTQNLRNIYETPTIAYNDEQALENIARVKEMVSTACQAGRTLLTELESKQLLAAYNIPTIQTRLAHNEVEAVALANEIGYPVVLKLHSQTITHKSEVDGVHLNLQNEAAVRQAYHLIKEAVSNLPPQKTPHFLGVTVQPMEDTRGFELILGSAIDRQFGPTLLFGMGGQTVELFNDHALGLPPLNSTLARRLMHQTQIYQAMQRLPDNRALDLTALEHLLVRFSYLVALHPRLKEVEINPLLISKRGLLALDARVLLYPPDVADEDLPGLTIRPYPLQYIKEDSLKDGTPIVLRPIRPEDESAIVDFHETLSEESVYYRYFQMMPLSHRTAHERLSRICFIDYDREMALVLEKRIPNTPPKILAVGRLIKLPTPGVAEFAIIVSDNWQGHGLGRKLLSTLLETAWQEGIHRVIGTVLPENYPMLNLCKKLGFSSKHLVEDRVIEVSIEAEPDEKISDKAD